MDRVTKIRTVFRKITGVSRSTIPKFLSPDQVRQVLTECDQNSALGMRNYAILLLLSRLGFRADEIVRLYSDESLWLSLSDAAIKNVEAHFSLDAARRSLQDLLADLDETN